MPYTEDSYVGRVTIYEIDELFDARALYAALVHARRVGTAVLAQRDDLRAAVQAISLQGRFSQQMRFPLGTFVSAAHGIWENLFARFYSGLASRSRTHDDRGIDASDQNLRGKQDAARALDAVIIEMLNCIRMQNGTLTREVFEAVTGVVWEEPAPH